MSWVWCEWQSKEKFDQWHDEIKNILGLPKLSLDADGNETQPLISEYTSAVNVENKWIATVEEAHVSNLIKTTLRPKPKNIEWAEVNNGNS